MYTIYQTLFQNVINILQVSYQNKTKINVCEIYEVPDLFITRCKL